MAHGDLATLLAPGAKARHLDLQALLAIASHEGASGGIGDGGHAFGPGQMNDAGGVLTGKLAGMTLAQKNAWAWGPQGINAWLDGVARVASGRTGADAITHIARDYERPANVQAEISDALAHYGGKSPGLPSSAAPRQPMSVGAQAPPLAAPAGNLLSSLVSSTNQSFGLGGSPSLATLLGGMSAPTPQASPKTLVPGAQSVPVLASVGGVKVDSKIAPTLQQIIGRFGVTPTSGFRDAAHNSAVGGAQNSDHLRGDAVDFGGTPAALQALYKYAQGRFPYVEPMAQAKDHVHISFRR